MGGATSHTRKDHQTPDWEKISDTNILRYFLEDIKKGTLKGSPRKKLVHLGLLKYSHIKNKTQLTQKALDLLEHRGSED